MDTKKQMIANFMAELEKHEELVGVVLVASTKDKQCFCASGGTARQSGTLMGRGVSQLSAYFRQFSDEESFDFADGFIHALADDRHNADIKNYTIEQLKEK